MSDASGDPAGTKTRDYLKDEYLMLMNTFQEIDSRSMTIKGWVATGATAALVLSFGKDVPERVAVVGAIFVASLVAALWCLEAGWKLQQSAVQDRLRTLEGFFRSDKDIIAYDEVGSRIEIDRINPFQAFNYWNRSLRLDNAIYPHEARPGFRGRPAYLRLLTASLRPNVALPYAIIIAFAIGATAFDIKGENNKPAVQTCAVTIQVADPSFTPSAVTCSLK